MKIHVELNRTEANSSIQQFSIQDSIKGARGAFDLAKLLMTITDMTVISPEHLAGEMVSRIIAQGNIKTLAQNLPLDLLVHARNNSLDS